MGSDLTAGAVEFEAESWSLNVEHKFCKKQDKQEVKRQDVIYGEERNRISLLSSVLTRIHSFTLQTPGFVCHVISIVKIIIISY